MNKYLEKIAMRADVRHLLRGAKSVSSDAKGLLRRSLDSSYPKGKTDIEKLRLGEGTHTENKRTYEGWKYNSRQFAFGPSWHNGYYNDPRSNWSAKLKQEIKHALENSKAGIDPKSPLGQIQKRRLKGSK